MITQNSIDGAISQRSVGGSNRKAVQKENTKNAKLLHDGCRGSK